jgi:hypothetical protein
MSRSEVSRRLLSPMVLFAAACFVAAFLGMRAHTERFISPETGAGYALGIIGGSLMLLLLLYPARKRVRWLRFIGGVKEWFQAHMVMGLVGPLLVLFHSNFQLGATNSNVALVCMLVVSVSGLFGRYFYGRIHMEFYGHQATLTDLRNNLDRLQQVSSTIPYMAELVTRLKSGEVKMVAGLEKVPHLLRPPVIGTRSFLLRWKLFRFIRNSVRSTAATRGLSREQRSRERTAGRDMVDRHIDAARKVAEFEAYERLFSLWHVLHLPMFFMLLIAGIVHVVSVHLY